jgi:hypothetical protein
MADHVLLGFEVGTGDRVEIPVAHMVVTGQTQQSGKTTTLEALIHRRGGAALAFMTKRGERAFGGAQRRVEPYFRERADWRFVSAILEAQVGERMKFERAWIMKACRRAKTLADVRDHVRELEGKARGGLAADMYMMLGEYLDDVLPSLGKIGHASGMKLHAGLNVVDLREFPVQVQGLVISSMLAWVHDHASGVVVAVPESWKFIPQGRNSPVRMAAVTLAREGAGLENFLWLDSQDLAGAEKEVVRQASVYLLGVQREANEIKRALAHVPAGIKKPRPEQLATLKRGQFYACWAERAVKVYVMPAWLDEARARQYALDGDVGTDGDRVLVEEMTAIGRSLAEKQDAEDLAALEALAAEQPEEDDEMTDEQLKQIEQRLTRTLSSTMERIAKRLETTPSSAAAPEDRVVGPDEPLSLSDLDVIYRHVRDQLKKEAPSLLKVLTAKNEIEVTVERNVIQADGKTLRGRLALLISEGWFKETKAGNAAYVELQRRGVSTAKPNVYRELDGLAGLGFLTKEDGGYLEVPGMKVNVVKANTRT